MIALKIILRFTDIIDLELADISSRFSIKYMIVVAQCASRLKISNPYIKEAPANIQVFHTEK